MHLIYFLLGVLVTSLCGSIFIILKQRKEIEELKQHSRPASPFNSSVNNEGDVCPIKNDIEEDDDNETDSKDAYPGPTLIPIDWIDSIYRHKNDWVNSIVTANLIQIKHYDLNKVTILANCKLIEPRKEGYVLVLEDPYAIVKTKPIPYGNIPDAEVQNFIGFILLINGIANGGGIKVESIKKQIYTRSII